jgi:HK97 family phage major capsid protein
VVDGMNVDLPQEKKSAMLALDAEVREIENTLRVVTGATERKALLDNPTGEFAAGNDAAGQAAPTEGKSLADQFLSSDAYMQMKSSNFRDLSGIFSVNAGLGHFDRKDIFGMSAGTVAGIPGLGRAQQLDFQERLRRPTRVRDLFPAERTNAAVLYGVRQTGFTNNAAPVAQRRAANETGAPTGGPTDVYGRKPKSTITLSTVTYPISTIAHLLDVHKNVLDDEPRLRGILDRDMIDGVKLVEDEEILYGDGVGENIRGVINTTGVQSYVQGSDGNTGDKKSAALRRAATRVMLSYFQPTGIAIHPFDWEDVELETDGNGAYRIAVNVTTGADARLWRMNVVDTPAILQDRFLLGAFGQGARLYDREQVAVTVSTENRDNYERNVVTLRAEERIALEVPRPEAFVYGTFT